jgi:hypothetical protein
VWNRWAAILSDRPSTGDEEARSEECGDFLRLHRGKRCVILAQHVDDSLFVIDGSVKRARQNQAGKNDGDSISHDSQLLGSPGSSIDAGLDVYHESSRCAVS